MSILLLAVLILPQETLPEAARATLDRLAPHLASDNPDVRGQAVKELTALRREFGERIRAEFKLRVRGAEADVRAIFDDQLAELDRIAALRAKLSLFDRLGLPPIAGKKWVSFNTGRATIFGSGNDQRLEFRYVQGWVISETPEEITLLQTNLKAGKHPKKPRRLPDLWNRVKDQHPRHLPLPGEAREIDYRKFCDDLEDRKEPDGFDRLTHYSEGGLGREVETALFAWWALQRGLENTCIDLLARLEKSLKKDETLTSVIAGGISAHVWYEGHLGANHGTPRPELFAKWNLAAELPENKMTATAKQMAAHYRKLIEEDQAWVEPADPEALPSDKKVLYWAHKLRDQAAEPTGNPGPCILIGGWSSLPAVPTNPAEHLLFLGWEAIPWLVEHLDDERPTRSLQWWRDHSPGSYHLVEVGECCQLILEIMTGLDLPSDGYMLQNSKKAEAKAKAIEWWEETRKGGEEKFWAGLLNQTEKAGPWRAASGLLRINAAKYLPALLSNAADPKGKLRHGLLRKIGGQVEAGHRKEIEALLKDPNYDVALEAGRILWNKFSSQGAVEKVVDLITAREADGKGDFNYFDNEAMDFIAGIDQDFARQILRGFLKKPSEGAGRSALYRCWRSFHPEIADLLVSMLDRKESAGYGSDPGATRVCDRAAGTLCRMTGCPEMVDDWGPVEDRDQVIARIKAWWKEHHAALDWGELRRQAKGRK